MGRPVDYLLVNRLHVVLEEGATAILEAVNKASYLLNEMTEDICRKYSAQSTTNAYISFGEKSGFGPHQDDHDVVILQNEGRKQWSFFCDGVSDYASIGTLAHASRENISVKNIVEKGDVLYIPKGVWHDVSAMGGPSLHLTISLVYPCIADFLQWLLNASKYDVPYDDIRPFNFNAEVTSDTARRFLNLCCTPQRLAEFLASYYSKIGSARIRPDVLGKASVGQGDVFLRVPALMMRSGRDPASGSIKVSALGRSFHLSPQELKILDAFDAQARWAYSDLLQLLPDALTALDKEGILSKLLRDGLLTKVNDGAQ